MTQKSNKVQFSACLESADEPEFLATHVDRYFHDRVKKTWDGGHIMHGRTPRAGDVMMVSNDYLSVANDRSIANAQIDALMETDNTVVMSAVYLHGDTAQSKFESDMAAWVGMPSGLLCQSGYAANVGLIQSISAPNTPAYVDMFAHASLWEGVTSARLTHRPFRHNDISHLESLISRHGPGLVIVDSVYSTNGSVAPLRELIELANRMHCVIIVDESHSLGTHGPHGSGMVANLGMTDQVHFITASLAKAFAGRAGIVFGSARLRHFIKYNSFPGIFSSALLPQEVAGLAQTLSVVQAADAARDRLHSNAEFLRHNLDELGYNVDNSRSQIIALEAGREQQTIILRDALESQGIFGSVFCAPATATKRSLIRLSVNAALSDEELSRVVRVCADIREEVGLSEWPSTRRKIAVRQQDANVA